LRADKIYLVGFMAAGKSSLARALGTRLEWPAEDVDDRIEAREQMTVSEIFKAHGEPHFRSVERAVLVDLLPLRPAVVATGGGTFVDPDNRALINGNGGSIWLDVPLAQIVARLPPDNRRPLADSRAQLEQLYAVRRSAYAQAHLRLDAARAPVEELVERAIDWLGT
jgi:shikimate kinase|tara:strand:+ start:2353 stop:2853 length:501 start_codon:yes stop_codon:yes gene_type:complete